MQRKILIMGLPGAGKTTLAAALAPLLNAVVFNADAVRANLSRDLGFSHEDRMEHARRMGWMCDRVVEAGGTVIADFICPTPETRTAFGEAFVIWVDRIEAGRFEDTNRMFVAPDHIGLHVTADGAPEFWAERALALLRPAFDPQKPTALFIGRYQPFHPGHQRLIEEGLRRVGQVCVAVRDTHGGARQQCARPDYLRQQQQRSAVLGADRLQLQRRQYRQPGPRRSADGERTHRGRNHRNQRCA
jgi:cytidyltransferase-like protein